MNYIGIGIILFNCSMVWGVFLIPYLVPWSVDPEHGRMNYKDTKPYMSAFLSVDLLTEFAAFSWTDFIDWRYIVQFPLYCTFSLTSSPLPPFPMYSLYRQCVTCGGVVGGCWNVLWTIFCRSFTLGFWPDSKPTKLLHHPKQKWPVKTTLRDWYL